MIILGYLVLLSIELILLQKKYHRILNVPALFSGIWCIFGATSCLGLYNMRVPGLKVHLMVWLFIILVDAIFLLFAKKKNNKRNNDETSAFALRSRVAKIQLFALLLLSPMILKVISALTQSASLVAVRNMYFSGTVFSSTYQDLLFRIIPMGMMDTLIIYYTYFAFEVKQYKYLGYALLDTILVTVINGGRYALILLLYAILILWMDGKTIVTVSLSFKRKIKKFATAVVAVMLVITISRGQEFLKSFFVYFSGSLSYLDYIIQNPMQFALNRPLYGYLTFAAFIEPIVLMLKVLGITTAKVPSYEFNIYCQRYYDIGNGKASIMFNANTSVLYYFLRDFGAVGIVIGALFVAGLTVKAFNCWQKGNRFGGMVFIYLGNVLFNTLMTYQLIGPTPCIIIITLYLCTHKKMFIGKKALKF